MCRPTNGDGAFIGRVADWNAHRRGPGAPPTREQMHGLLSRREPHIGCMGPPHWMITLQDEAEVRQEEIEMKWQSLADRIIAMRN